MHHKTEHTRLQAILYQDNWCSPLVGSFTPAYQLKDVVVLGLLTQNGRTYELVLPTAIQHAELLCLSSCPVEFSTPLARATKQASSNETSSNTRFIVKAPCDGFLTITRDDKPLFVPGDIVQIGATVAQIELMKLGVDVTYQGEKPAKFVRYTSKTTIKNGEMVCELDRLT